MSGAHIFHANLNHSHSLPAICNLHPHSLTGCGVANGPAPLNLLQEDKFREARDSANVMGQQLFKLKEHVRAWRGDGEKLCMSLADEREHVGAMYEQFRCGRNVRGSR